jgi:hypothetical protein
MIVMMVMMAVAISQPQCNQVEVVTDGTPYEIRMGEGVMTSHESNLWQEHTSGEWWVKVDGVVVAGGNLCLDFIGPPLADEVVADDVFEDYPVLIEDGGLGRYGGPVLIEPIGLIDLIEIDVLPKEVLTGDRRVR